MYTSSGMQRPWRARRPGVDAGPLPWPLAPPSSRCLFTRSRRAHDQSWPAMGSLLALMALASACMLATVTLSSTSLLTAPAVGVAAGAAAGAAVVGAAADVPERSMAAKLSNCITRKEIGKGGEVAPTTAAPGTGAGARSADVRLQRRPLLALRASPRRCQSRWRTTAAEGSQR